MDIIAVAPAKVPVYVTHYSHGLNCIALPLCFQVKVKLNLHGVVGVESVQQVDEEEYEEKVKRPAPKVCLVLRPSQ